MSFLAPITRATASAALAIALMGMAGAQAQTLLSVSAEPTTIKAGGTVNITAQFDLSQAQNCHVRIHFGDGTTSNAKINQAKDASFVVPHTYAAPGSYTVMVEPKTALPLLKCTGANQKVVVTVQAAPAAAPAPAPTPAAATAAATAARGEARPAAAAAATPSCPNGWTLAPKSVNKKTGAFQCTAKPGTAAPADRPSCPGNLDYYESAKKGQLGCKA